VPDVAAFAAHVAESGWLVALAIVPSFLNLYSVRTFEEEKALLLRSLAIFTSAALVTWMAIARQRRLVRSAHSLWRLPLVASVLGFFGVLLISTIASVAPHSSFWGVYVRNHGTYTWLAYLAIFVAGLLVCRSWERVDRVITVMLIGSVPPASYAVLQHFGIDLISWSHEEGMTGRVSSTLGNPIFLAALLIMVVPLTLARLIGSFAGGDATIRSELKAPGADVLTRRAVYSALLAVQMLAIVYTQSRGPFVGFLFGIAYFVLLMAAVRRVRWPVVLVAALLAVAPLARHNAVFRGGIDSFGRLGNLFDLQQASGKSRTLLWRGAAALLVENPIRTLIGFGPETLALEFHHVYPPELLHYESRDASPDRAHNEVLDALVTTGVLGALAEIGLFVSCLYHGLRSLGLVSSLADRNGFVAAIGFGSVGGAFIPYLATGNVYFSPLGVPLGIAIALLGQPAYLALRRRACVPSALGPRAPMLAALCAGILAHFVEIQVGVAISVTRLYFFTYASLTTAIGLLASVPAEPARGAAQESVYDLPSAGSRELVLGASVGVLLGTLIFDFFSAARSGTALIGFLLIPWLFGAALVLEEALRAREPGTWMARLRTYASASIGIGALFAIAEKLWQRDTPNRGESAVAAVNGAGLHLAEHVSVFYALAAISILFLAAALARRHQSAVSGELTWPLVTTVFPFVALAALLVRTNLSVLRADSFAKVGETYEHRRAWSGAVYAYEEALRRWPSQEALAIDLARVLLARMLEVGTRSRQRLDADALRAIDVLQAAAATHPLNPFLPAGMARVYLNWAQLGDPAETYHRLDLATVAYQRALELRPNDVPLWNELAALYIARGDLDHGFAVIAHSIEIDALFPETYCLRGDAHLRAQRYWEALEDYDRALAVDPKSQPGLLGRATALAHLGRVEEAVATTARARELSRDDLAGHRELAMLYERTGQFNDALAEANKALALARPIERPSLEALLERLKNQVPK
jgi:tetratricopeptide (TPR) repeat protein/O-antigen ligase